MTQTYPRAGRRDAAASPNRSMLLSTVAVALAGIMGATPSLAKDSLTVTAYSGPWETAMRKCFFEPFTAATGTEILVETGIDFVTYSKLRQQKDAPTIDVAWLDGGYSKQAWKEGLTEAIDPAKVPDIASISPRSVNKTDDGTIHSIGTGYYSYTLAYDPKEVDPAPTSWFDLWKPEYENRVYAPAPAQALFAPLMIHLNKQLGGDSSNFEPIISKFSELKPSSYYEASGVMNATIQTGEVVLGIYFPNTTWQLADQGVSITTATPKEGIVASDIQVQLVKGSPKKELAQSFINFLIQPEHLTCIAEEIYLGPPLDDVKLSEKAAKRMPWGAGGSVKDLVLSDWDEVNAKREELRDLWMRRVVGQ